MGLRIYINRKTPTIGITGPDKGGVMAWLFTALGVRLAGGKPVRITPARPRTADGLQGLIIGGGADVDPDVYQQEDVLEEYLRRSIHHPRKSLLQRLGRVASKAYYPFLFFMRKLFSRSRGWSLDKARDHLEFQLLDQAVKKGLPVLGICRGSQLLNVYLGGSLHQDISNFYFEEPNPSSVFPVKRVSIKQESRLAEVLGAYRLKVNALHHQAVKEPGENIAVVAWENNGIVQAVEHVKAPFLMGVQWHPEYLPQRPRQRRIFKALVEAARHVHSQIEQPDMQEALARPMAGVMEALEEQEQRSLNRHTTSRN